MRQSRRRHSNRQHKKHTTRTPKSDTRETRGGTTSSRRSFSATRRGCFASCGSAASSSRRSSMPLPTCRSSAAVGAVSSSPTKNACCFTRLLHTRSDPSSSTPTIRNSQSSRVQFSRCVGCWQLPGPLDCLDTGQSKSLQHEQFRLNSAVCSIVWTRSPSGPT